MSSSPTSSVLGIKRSHDDSDCESVIMEPDSPRASSHQETSRTAAFAGEPALKRARKEGDKDEKKNEGDRPQEQPATAIPSTATPHPKTSEAAPPPEAGPSATKKPKEMWFEDGDIIIKVGDEAFKLHKAKLSEHCGIFRHLFDTPCIEAGEAGDQGLPVFEDISSLDIWRVLIRLIYNPEKFMQRGIHWVEIVHLFEIGRKFDCLLARDAAVHFFSSIYPTSIESMKCLRTVRSLVSRVPDKVHFRALRVAQEYKVHECLPAVWYSLLEYTDEELIFGDKGKTHHWMLTREELATLFKARNTLRKERKSWLLSFLTPVWKMGNPSLRGSECFMEATLGGYDCETWLTRLQMLWDKIPDAFENPMQPLRMLRPESMGIITKRLCPGCRAHVKTAMEHGQMIMWLCLPHKFGLGSWIDIEQKVDQARRDHVEWSTGVEVDKLPDFEELLTYGEEDGEPVDDDEISLEEYSDDLSHLIGGQPDASSDADWQNWLA
ncbi:hypothetical protein EWM64_g8610 [Hericium alpestre]|uniref:BTB domain-containing protein n=1 Tax=Hericium alpestre TaxID=135208 RepID=A0A4Y9ZKX2_9AGAM|nr:hypothetical protein EWM64_g8610 [Hericium alpestre]